MRVISHILFGIPILKQEPSEMMERWEKGLKDKTQFIYQQLKAKIPDETKFHQRIVSPSTRKYQPFVHPDFISWSGDGKEVILAKHAHKLKTSYGKYRGKLAHSYLAEAGKIFQQHVENAKSSYGQGMLRWSLPFTGTRLNPGPVVCAGLWLTGAEQVSGELGGAILKRGHPSLITTNRARGLFKAALIPRLIQAGANIIKANFDRPIMKAENDLTNQIVQNFVDRELKLIPFKTGGRSRVDYRVKLTGFYLEIKVSQKS